ncbi:MAG: hypothetical protein ACRD2W_08085 [Acidimicrobiales bacterium]
MPAGGGTGRPFGAFVALVASQWPLTEDEVVQGRPIAIFATISFEGTAVRVAASTPCRPSAAPARSGSPTCAT